jgi:hypothetical protein
MLADVSPKGDESEDKRGDAQHKNNKQYAHGNPVQG